MKGLKSLAFTLAEVIIVVGIIGIIAELTIPQLMENVQEQEFKGAAKTAYSKAYQAIMQMKAEQGGSLFPFYNDVNAFKPEFMKYFKVIKDCSIKDCVPSSENSTIYKTINGIEGYTLYMDEGQFVTADGMFWGIQNSNNIYVENNLMISVDVNGYMKKPNAFGKDLFMFQYIDENLYPMGAENTHLKANIYCNRQNKGTYSGLGCMYYVMQGISY